jgi:hypothetical protein
MAHFRATIEGSRGLASRLGTPKSGLKVTANGWDIGVTVYADVSPDGEDRFEILLTGGSNGAVNPIQLGTFTASDLKSRKSA